MDKEINIMQLKDRLSEISVQLENLLTTMCVLYYGFESNVFEENASHCIQVLLTYAEKIKTDIDSLNNEHLE